VSGARDNRPHSNLHVPMHVQILDSMAAQEHHSGETPGLNLPVAVLRCREYLPATPQDPAHPPGGVLRSGAYGISVRLHRADRSRV
jgi:hypothetical protein